MTVIPDGHSAVVVTRPANVAANRSEDAVFVARAALKRAYTLRATAELQLSQLRGRVDRLEAEAHG